MKLRTSLERRSFVKLMLASASGLLLPEYLADPFKGRSQVSVVSSPKYLLTWHQKIMGKAWEIKSRVIDCDHSKTPIVLEEPIGLYIANVKLECVAHELANVKLEYTDVVREVR